ncbi:GntR family transcriptional regulator [Mesorhizobium sp. M4B.F.Ca.ET.190.01.1.1]|uniref:GntR family transcriptional regulator n=1 Tax=unclassified Mesorhizobium TaxID=325217 RepID=UPI0010921487|nr:MULTISPECIES: GntR family transcriptional regulator [unclassified Mesorhizobium]TGR15150.1 GntR family transcriptional regulator [Mesorhizobium sp. M4B.F.Ca.ET.200.01.1.1]TGS23024.1 GntR family transcriptional regulator [Mesorhizobium sp. M4B.F.Ca.ET.190.01.1.1]TGT33860.1 GntR family transcriptional regulator [Mesorhizobium sp. M4B.F.Ca.ET.172.01.1.1]
MNDSKAQARRQSSGSERFRLMHGELRNRICLLTYPPGTLLIEGALAEEFGVSRTPIRRVLSYLEFEGFVETRNGVGTIVSEININEIKYAYELRAHLATQIGILSPVAPTEAGIETLSKVLTKVRSAGIELTNDEYWRANNILQDQLNLLTSNATFAKMTTSLYYLTNRNWQVMLPKMNWSDIVDKFVAELIGTIERMVALDVVGVGLIRRNEIIRGFERLREQNGNWTLRSTS